MDFSWNQFKPLPIIQPLKHILKGKKIKRRDIEQSQKNVILKERRISVPLMDPELTYGMSPEGPKLYLKPFVL